MMRGPLLNKEKTDKINLLLACSSCSFLQIIILFFIFFLAKVSCNYNIEFVFGGLFRSLG